MLLTLRSWIIANPRISLIILAFATALGAGLSALLYPLEYTPLFVGGGILGIIFLLICLKNPSYALCFTLLIIFLPDGLLPVNIQSNLNRFLTVATFGIWLLDYIYHRRQIVITPTAVFMFGFLLWSTTTILWASSVDISLNSIQQYVLRFLLFLFLLPNMIRSKKDINYLMIVIALSGWLLAAASVFRVVTMGYVAGSRLDVLGENENSLGLSLLISLSGVLWMALRYQNRDISISKLLSYFYLLISIIIIAMSGSRGSAISLVITLLLLLGKSTRRWGLIGLVVILLGLLISPVVFSTTLDRFAVTAGDTILGGREAIWQATWQLIQRQPWTGVGIGNAPFAVISFVRLFRSIGASEWVAIHNPVLAIWAETGIPGLVLYLSVLGSAIWIFVKNRFISRKSTHQTLSHYFPLISAIFIGYMLSWIKGGGMESEHTYFFMVSFLLIPSHLETKPEWQ